MNFRKGNIIVRDDLVYPEGALVVDEFDAAGGLLAHPLGGGMQLSISPEQLTRFEIVSELEKTPVFHRAVFEMDAIKGRFEGWSDGRLWNGWAKPKFEFAEASKIVATLKPPGRYDGALDAFVTSLTDGEEDIWHGETIALPDGGTVKVYGVGAGAWIWDEVSE